MHSAPVAGDRLLSGLDVEQRAAVESVAERTCVVAGPGAGKTSVLAARIVTLVRLRGVAPEAIAAFTFTREAAAELRRRVAQTIGDETAARVTCSTMHAYSAGVIARAFDDGYRIADDDEEERVRRDLVEGPTRLPYKVGHRKLRTWLERFGAGLGDPVDLAEASTFSTYLSTALHRFGAAKVRPRWALIVTATAILQGRHGNAWEGEIERCRAEMERARRFRHVLVDEAQDVTPAEAAFLACFVRSAYFAVLDPDQSIFGWRYAEPANLWPLVSGPVSKVASYQLATSYRFGPSIAAAATAWIGRNPPLIGSGGPSLVRECGSEIAAEVEALRGRHGPGGVAILARTNLECDSLVASGMLGRDAVHVTRAGRDRASALLRLVVRVARVLVNPADDASFVELAHDTGFGDFVARWRREAGILPLSEVARADLAAREWWVGRLLDGRSFAAFRDLAQDVAIAEAWGLADSAEAFEVARASGLLDLPIADALDAYATRTEESGFDAARRAGKVAVATIHAAKGREWPAVVLWGEPAIPPADPEERRVFYVARTRARSELVVVRAERTGRQA